MSSNEIQISEESLIKCSWTSEKDLGRGAKRHFVPASLEDAKRLLRKSVEELSNNRMQRVHVCHGCHATLGNGTHQGSAIGKAKCTFPHSVFCKGGIVENESWRACPEGYIYNPDVEIQSYTGLTDTLDPSGFQPGALRRSTPAGSTHSLEEQSTVVRNQDSQSQVSDIERQDRLLRQASGEGARARTVVVSEASVHCSPTETRNKQGSNDGINDLPPHILAQIQDFRSRNQASNEARDRPVSNFNIGHLRSNQGLREQVEVGVNVLREKIPSLAAAPSANLGHQGQVTQQRSVENADRYERVIDQTNGRQYATPSYSQPGIQHGENDQIRTPHNLQGQRIRNHFAQISPEREYYPHQYSHRDRKFEYRCSPTSGRVWQVEVPVGPDHSHNTNNQNQASYRIEYRCSPTSGRVWKEQIPVSPTPRQVYHLEWRIHPHTGETYQVEVPTLNPQTQFKNHNDGYPVYQQRPRYDRSDVGNLPTHMSAPRGVAQSIQQQYSVAQDQTIRQQVHRNGDITGISRLEKSSNKKNSKVVDLPRFCPVKWAKTATNNTINLPLYTWAVVSELESSLSGRGDKFSEQEVLGKIRHLKNVAEVCCLNSSSTDFSTYGWAIARDYALKVEDEVAQGFANWSEMHHGQACQPRKFKTRSESRQNLSTLAQGNANQSYTIEATCEVKTGQVLTPYNIKISSQVLLSNDEVEFIRGGKKICVVEDF